MVGSSQIDKAGYRLNVGIVLLNQNNRVFWAERQDCNTAWQFPQGGIDKGETTRAALYRELYEEIGLGAKDVKILAKSLQWYRYQLPPEFRQRVESAIGQKQRWYLLRLLTDESNIALDRSPHPEFSRWQWVDYWHPATAIIEFKKEVYRKVLQEFSIYISSDII